MDHTYVEEHQVIDRYVMGKLPAAEAEPFEEHYLSCPQCLDQLELAETEQRAFKRMAQQEAEKVAAVRQLTLVAWLARLGRSRQAAVLGMAGMALVLAVLLPWGLAVRQIGQSERELSQARTALGEERERAAAGSRLGETAARLQAELETNRRDLAEERAAREQAAAELERSREPQGNVPILFLNAERGGEAGSPADPAGPTSRLRLPPASGWVVLALEIDPPHQPTYRVVLRNTRGQELWRGAGLRLDERETLSLSLPAALLAPGDYTLAAEGLASSEKPVAAGRFTFRVLPAG